MWFWLILVAIVGVLIVMPRWWSEPPMPLDGPPPPWLQRALERADQGRPLPHGGGRHESLMLLDRDGQSLQGPPPSPHLQRQLDEMLGRPPALYPLDGWVYAGPFAVGRDPDGPVLFARRPAPHAGAVIARFVGTEPLLAFSLFLAASGLGCGLLARALGRPLRQLQQTAQALAHGAWQSRPAYKLQQRGDEFGALARAMTTMADALERELQARQTLLHYVSHELKSPLTRIRLAAGLLRRQQSEDTLGQLERAVTQLDERLNQVLFLTRSQTPIARPQPVDLALLAEQAVADLQLVVASRDAVIEVQISKPLSIVGDGTMLRALLDNLLDNAIRHARQRVQLTLSSTGQQLQLTVADDGPGLTLEGEADPFSPFVQGQGHSGQAGLGLAIVAAVARQHGGQVKAEASPLGGLAVTVSLPLG